MDVTPKEEIRFSARPAPFKSERVFSCVPAGLTVQQHIDRNIFDPEMRRYAEVRINGAVIHPEFWRVVKPKPGVTIEVTVVPQGGFKKILRSVLTLALIVASFYIPTIAIAGVSAQTAQAINAGIQTLAIFAGQLLINALIPPSLPKNQSEEPRITTSGFQNEARPGRPVPTLFGRLRYYPPFAALPYSEVVGDDQYVRALFCFGYGPLELSDFKFGDTSIDDYEDVQVEVKQGFPGESDPLLFQNDVTQQDLNTELTASTAQVITTAAGTDEAEVDILFPEGLVHFTKKGKRENQTVSFTVEYRETGSGTWLTPFAGLGTGIVDPTTFSAGTTTRSFTDNTAQPKLVSVHLRFDAPAQYDIRVTRTTADFTDDADRGSSFLNALRSIKHQSPVNLDGMCLVAIRVRTTRQIRNELRRFNAIAQRLYPLLSNGSFTDPVSGQNNDAHKTRSPAAAYAYALRGSAAARNIADDRIDLTSIENWWTATEQDAPNETAGTPYWTFDHVIDYPTTLFDTMKVIAGAGRARPTIIDGKYGVVRDVNQSYPVQMFTPRNSRNLKGSFGYTDIPHVLNVHIADEDREYMEHVVPVYQDGFDENTATKSDRLDLVGVVRSGQAWREGRYHLAQAELRPETYEFETDIEGIVCQAGDWIRLQHDVPGFGIGQGRIISGTTSQITMDSWVNLESGKTYIARIRRQETTEADRFMDGTITTAAGETDTLDFSPALDFTPEEGDLVVIGESNTITRDLVVKAIEPLSDLEWRIIALDLAPGVHTADTGTIPDFNPFATGLAQGAPGLVRNLDLTELVRFQGGVSRSYVGASWQPPGGLEVDFYEVYRQDPNSEWQLLERTESVKYEIPFQLQPGELVTIAVVAVGIDGRRLPPGQAATASITLDGDADAPDIVNNLQTTARPEAIEVEWSNPTGEPDLAAVNLYVNTTDDRATATLLKTVKTDTNAATGFYFHQLGAVGATRYYWARPVDSEGNEGDWNAVAGVIGTSGDIRAVTYRQSNAPSNPLDGDFWFDTDDNKMYRWNEGTDTWEFVASYNTGALADKDTIDNGDIDNNAVTTLKIAPQSITELVATFTAGVQTITTTAKTSIQSVSITSTENNGGNVYIVFTCGWGSDSTNNDNPAFVVEAWEGGSFARTVLSFNYNRLRSNPDATHPAPVTAIDNPTAGVSLQYRVYVTLASGETATFEDRSLAAFQAKDDR